MAERGLKFPLKGAVKPSFRIYRNLIFKNRSILSNRAVKLSRTIKLSYRTVSTSSSFVVLSCIYTHQNLTTCTLIIAIIIPVKQITNCNS